MVEMKPPHGLRISTKAAGPAGLRDEDLLHLPSSSGHRLGSASSAAVIAATVEDESRLAMLGAGHDRLPEAGPASRLGLRRSPQPGRAPRLEAIPCQPMPHGRLAPIEPSGDLRDRQPRPDQRRQLLSCQAASRRMPVGVDRPQPVASHPIRHCRFMPADASADRRERHAFVEQALQKRPIHASILASRMCNLTPRSGMPEPNLCQRGNSGARAEHSPRDDAPLTHARATAVSYAPADTVSPRAGQRGQLPRGRRGQRGQLRAGQHGQPPRASAVSAGQHGHPRAGSAAGGALIG
jgi:hypothetical protein